MIIGAVIKIVTNLILVSNPDINIYGVPYGTTLCYIFIFVADLAFLIHYSKQRINLISTLGKPFAAAAVSATANTKYRFIYLYLWFSISCQRPQPLPHIHILFRGRISAF